MSLAKRLALSIARLYAYAMAPDDHTEQERREIINQAGEAIDAANLLAWFEQEMKSRDIDLSVGCLGSGDDVFFVVGWGYLNDPSKDVEVTHDWLIEAIQLAKAEACSQPEVDERNSESKNHDEGTTP